MAGSLAQQLHFKTEPFTFGKNVFDSTSKHWAFFTYNDGIGFVTDSSRLLYLIMQEKELFLKKANQIRNMKELQRP